MRQLLGFFALILALTSCGQTFQKDIKTEKYEMSETPEKWKSLNEANYSIHYPDTFDLDMSGQMGVSFILFSKVISPQDMFRENVNLLVQDLTGQNIDLDKYVDISEDQIKTMIIEGNLLDSKRLTGSNNEYHRLVYTGKQGQYDLKWQQFYWVKNKKAYVLTLTCEANQYDNYVSVGEKIMKSFILK